MDRDYIVGLMLIIFSVLITTEGHIVSTTYGDILGRESVTPNGKQFFIFQGVPFAAPPLGNLRFADPQEPANWTDVKDCRSKCIECLQIAEETTEFETEDCLTLSIYTPKLPEDLGESNLAVMAYIYGGGFYKGNTCQDSYGPEFFMDRDVVVVMINYRLGAFGFLSTEDEVISGNFGLKDQQLGLKWVQKNIKAFSGDPEKITIFGNSAGAASVGYQILNMKNEGLFRGAIMSSGTPLGLWTFQKHPRRVAYLTAQLINSSTIIETSEELVEFLRSTPASDVKRASFELKNRDPFGYKQYLHGYYYAPTLESKSDNSFLVNHSYYSLEYGNFIHVPIMIGLNSEEQIDIDNFTSLMRSYDSDNKLLVSDHLNIVDDVRKKEAGNSIYEIYTENNITLENSLDRGIRFFSDQKMNFGILKHAYFVSNFSDVFLYQFSYDGLMGSGSNYVEGAGTVEHAEDNNYIWRRNLSTSNNTNLDIFPESDLAVQKRLLDLYTNFAKYLNPTNDEDPILQNVIWPTINLDDPDGVIYLDIGADLELKTNLKEDTFSKWDEIFLKYAVKPYNAY